MKAAAILLALAAPIAASAAGFAPLSPVDTGETCYTWTGGNFSAGSFTKCAPNVVIVAAATPAPLAAPPTANPVMVPMQSCAPPPPKKPIVRKKRAPVKC